LTIKNVNLENVVMGYVPPLPSVPTKSCDKKLLMSIHFLIHLDFVAVVPNVPKPAQQEQYKLEALDKEMKNC